MPSLYIPSTDTMILDYAHRYIHPDTGEVYGGTDYDRTDKLCEIGAVPLRMQSPSAGMLADGWEIVIDDSGPGYVRRPTSESPAPLPPAEPQVYTKLAIRRAMRSLGTEAQLDALLDASPVFRADWTDATEIDLADPVLAQALAGAEIDVAAIVAAMGGVV